MWWWGRLHRLANDALRLGYFEEFTALTHRWLERWRGSLTVKEAVAATRKDSICRATTNRTKQKILLPRVSNASNKMLGSAQELATNSKLNQTAPMIEMQSILPCTQVGSFSVCCNFRLCAASTGVHNDLGHNYLNVLHLCDKDPLAAL
jgi:hypothetical protein